MINEEININENTKANRGTKEEGKGSMGSAGVDSAVRTVRQKIGEIREGVLPSVILVIDTNILADYGWKRDKTILYLIETLLPQHYSDILIVVPRICAVEFKCISDEEVKSWSNLGESIKRRLHDIKRYQNFKNLSKSLESDIYEINKLVAALKGDPKSVLDALSGLIFYFDESLPLQYESAYYISKDPEYDLAFEDALVFSFIKIVGLAFEKESTVMFLTNDNDFKKEKVLNELKKVRVAVYIKKSGKCVNDVKKLVENKR